MKYSRKSDSTTRQTAGFQTLENFWGVQSGAFCSVSYKNKGQPWKLDLQLDVETLTSH